jgi:hypothetical protein
MAKFSPKVRPTNLPVAATKGVKPPFLFPVDPSDKVNFEFWEKMRDHHEKQGELLTVDGMYDYARGAFDGDDLDDLFKQIDKFYGQEERSSKPTPKAAKAAKPVKETAMATATKTAPAKATKKAAPVKATNGKANPKGPAPAKNGKAAPAKVKATKAPRPPAAPTGKVVFEKTVQGLDVRVREVNGSYRGTVNDYPMRGVLRFFGAKGKTPDEARNALARAMKGWKGGEDYSAAMVEEGHVGSGAREADGQKGSFGPAPEALMKDKKTAQALLALCKG